MKLKNRMISVIILCIVTIFPGVLTANEYLSQEKERLLFEEIPVVISGSLTAQPITEAATTMTVISSEDIHYSGATNIPDILRTVAGVDVMTISNRDQQVGVRGFITPANNKLLVLIDGRTMYSDMYGAVFWDMFPIGMEEIDRIEIVKSPASSIYGANAFSGVINIITKSPQQVIGTHLNFSVGEDHILIGSLIHGGELFKKKIQYKVSTQWDQLDERYQDQQQIAGVFRVNAQATYTIDEKRKVTFSFGHAYSQDRRLFNTRTSGPGLLDYKNDAFQLDAEFGNIRFRTFYKVERPYDMGASIITAAWQVNTLNAELIHSFSLGEKQSLAWGVNLRINWQEENNFILDSHTQALTALFFEDQIKIAKNLRLTLGGRFDTHPLTKGKFSPRGTLIYSPFKDHIFRASVSRAFRNPAFTDSYQFSERKRTMTLRPPYPPISVTTTMITQGNSNLKPEAITSYEFGIRSTWTRQFKSELNLFYNRFADFFDQTRTFTFYEANELFPGSPAETFQKQMTMTYDNITSGRAWGGEVSLEFDFSKTISGFLNYSYQDFRSHEKDDEPGSDDSQLDEMRTENPRNKVNAGLRFLFKKNFSANLLAHWVGATQKIVRQQGGSFNLQDVNDYMIVNLRIGFVFWKKKAEVAAAVLNLFNLHHYEFPSFRPGPFPGPFPVDNDDEELGRRIVFTFSYNF